MRNLLYISIGMSLAIVVGALVHYQWRTDTLRDSTTHLRNRTAETLDTNIETPVVSRRNTVVESVVESAVESDVTDNIPVDIDNLTLDDLPDEAFDLTPEEHAMVEAAFLEFDEIMAEFNEVVADFYEQYARFEEEMARDTPWKRRSAELQPKLKQAEAERLAALRERDRVNARLAALGE